MVCGYRTGDHVHDECELMMLNAPDFTVKDLIIIPTWDFSGFFVLPAAGMIYQAL
jgi:hypothetical protein